MRLPDAEVLVLNSSDVDREFQQRTQGRPKFLFVDLTKWLAVLRLVLELLFMQRAPLLLLMFVKSIFEEHPERQLKTFIGVTPSRRVALHVNLDKTSWLTRETFTAQAASFSRC
jgi:hypothetical protein